MPSWEYYYLSDEDLGALIAYLKQLPPVERQMPELDLGPMGRAMMVAGQGNFRLSAARIDHDAPRPTAPEPGPTVAYGEYLSYSCMGCHGPDLAGGPISGAPPSWPPAANITPHEQGIGAWSRADFFRALRQQVRPDGAPIDPVMPADMGKMTDQELTALWKYLQTVEPKPGPDA
jgi:mono/diheme cytochrome c family protein